MMIAIRIKTIYLQYLFYDIENQKHIKYRHIYYSNTGINFVWSRFQLGNDYVSAGQSDELESPDTNVEEQQDEVNLDSRNEVEE